jgi:importin subunit beta-1
MLDYLNELREGILEAYTGIIQGLKDEDSASESTTACLLLLEPHVPAIIHFVSTAAQDPDHTDTIIHNCAGLVGYLVSYGLLFLSYNQIFQQ